MHNIRNKCIALLLLISLVGSSAVTLFPQKADAVFGVGDVVTDPGNTIQGTFTAFSTAASSVQDYLLNYKETILDPIAHFAAQALLQQLTSSIVNWINSGFDGSPSFVTDPAGFFMDVADETIGSFIADNADLKFLCSPFSLDLRLALAFKYRPFQRKIGCTLSKVIANTTNAANNASINGFTAGDFKQGGWPAFVSMTTEPQNNGYGAYLESDYELSWKLGDKQSQKKEEISQGRGFLSWKKCLKYADEGQKVNGDWQIDSETGDKTWVPGGTASADTENVAKDTAAGKRTCEKEETQTPGSVIEHSINQSLGNGEDSLKLADEFNEIVNALFAQLVKMALSAGLKGLSGSNPSDKGSYLKQIEAEQKKQTEQFRNLQTGLLQGVSKSLTSEYDYRNNKSSSLDQTITTKNMFDDVKTCYTDKISGANTSQGRKLTPAQLEFAQTKIAAADSVISLKIAPIANPLVAAINEVNLKINSLTTMKTLAENASTVDEFGPLSAQYANLLPLLHTIVDVGNSATEKEAVASAMTPLNDQARIMQQECQIYPNNPTINKLGGTSKINASTTPQ